MNETLMIKTGAWHMENVEISWFCPRTIKALVSPCGQFAIDLRNDPPTQKFCTIVGWRITHLATGLLLLASLFEGYDLNEERCKQFCEAIATLRNWNAIRKDLSPDKEVLRAELAAIAKQLLTPSVP